MTKDTLAACLNGREYPLTIGAGEKQAAKDAGLVIVYGASDDLMELDGAIYDEVDAYEGTTILVDSFGMQTTFERLKDDDADEKDFEDYFNRKGCGRGIKAVWCDRGYSWFYETDIPHATFDIMEDGEPYCRGIVFSLEDL